MCKGSVSVPFEAENGLKGTGGLPDVTMKILLVVYFLQSGNRNMIFMLRYFSWQHQDCVMVNRSSTMKY